MPSCFEGFFFDLTAWPDEAGNLAAGFLQTVRCHSLNRHIFNHVILT